MVLVWLLGKENGEAAEALVLVVGKEGKVEVGLSFDPKLGKTEPLAVDFVSVLLGVSKPVNPAKEAIGSAGFVFSLLLEAELEEAEEVELLELNPPNVTVCAVSNNINQ